MGDTTGCGAFDTHVLSALRNTVFDGTSIWSNSASWSADSSIDSSLMNAVRADSASSAAAFLILLGAHFARASVSVCFVGLGSKALGFRAFRL